MNWLTKIIVSIGAAFSSLLGLGMSHSAATGTSSLSPSPVPAQQAVGTSQPSQASDQQSIIDNVTAMLNGYRNANTLQDAENVTAKYGSQKANQQFQLGISSIPPSAQQAMQSMLIKIERSYPDPASLRFAVSIEGDMATATASTATTTYTSAQKTNNITASYRNSLTIPLQKEDGQWKVDTIILSSNGFSVPIPNGQ